MFINYNTEFRGLNISAMLQCKLKFCPGFGPLVALMEVFGLHVHTVLNVVYQGRNFFLKYYILIDDAQSCVTRDCRLRYQGSGGI